MRVEFLTSTMQEHSKHSNRKVKARSHYDTYINEPVFFSSSFAPWCPACQQVGPVWSTLALKAEKLGINVGEVDTNKEPGKSLFCYYGNKYTLFDGLTYNMCGYFVSYIVFF